jgi:ABC-type uncharacterized transport system ATPase subunit
MHKNNAVKDVSLQVRSGEIVCIAGIDGNGQTELVYGLTGLEAAPRRNKPLRQDITRASIRERSKTGMSHIPEDRHKHGLVLDFTLEQNLVLQRYFGAPVRARTASSNSTPCAPTPDKLIEQYDVRSGQGPVTIARSMSGGNQQKAIVAREIDKDPSCWWPSSPRAVWTWAPSNTSTSSWSPSATPARACCWCRWSSTRS